MHPKEADRMGNSVDPDQTASEGQTASDLGLHYCSDLSRIITVILVTIKIQKIWTSEKFAVITLKF